MSDTPRTDFVAHESGDPEWNRSINRFGRMQSHAQILERELAEAVAKERERCARVCDEMANSRYLLDDERQVAHSCAEAIRKGE